MACCPCVRSEERRGKGTGEEGSGSRKEGNCCEEVCCRRCFRARGEIVRNTFVACTCAACAMEVRLHRVERREVLVNRLLLLFESRVCQALFWRMVFRDMSARDHSNTDVRFG